MNKKTTYTVDDERYYFNYHLLNNLMQQAEEKGIPIEVQHIEIQKKCGFSKSTINNWRNSSHSPRNLKDIKKLAKHYNRDYMDFLVFSAKINNCLELANENNHLIKENKNLKRTINENKEMYIKIINKSAKISRNEYNQKLLELNNSFEDLKRMAEHNAIQHFTEEIKLNQTLCELTTQKEEIENDLIKIEKQKKIIIKFLEFVFWMLVISLSLSTTNTLYQFETPFAISFCIEFSISILSVLIIKNSTKEKFIRKFSPLFFFALAPFFKLYHIKKNLILLGFSVSILLLSLNLGKSKTKLICVCFYAGVSVWFLFKLIFFLI